jgi:hypothetical protein
MTFSSRPRSPARWTSWSLWTIAPLALVLTLAAGCADKHIGRPCDLGAVSPDGGTTTGTTATIYSGALECPSRICLQPANETNSLAGPMCTDTCSSDGDCDGENTGGCKTGFKCLIETTVGPLCCHRLCVCKDFVDLTNVAVDQSSKQTSCMANPIGSCEHSP